MVPVPKLKPVTDINKHLRPISLIFVISKLVQNFVVALHFGPVVLEVIDPNPYGCIPASSTLDALASMLHTWLQAPDGSGAAVRVVPFDYRKAFDISDHTLWFSVSCKDIVNFYSCTVTRPVLEYCSPIFHHSLPDHLSARVQKRVLSIIASDKSYKHCLVSLGLSTLYDRRNNHCIKLFKGYILGSAHTRLPVLSPNHQGYDNTIHERAYDLPRFCTNRFKKSFKAAMCGRVNMLL